MLHRAYSVLAVRDADAATRLIRGVATTPMPDRSGDVIDPLGIRFTNPLPLLWHHDATRPVGTATFDPPTRDGVTFEATLPRVTEAGPLRDRIEEAWQSIQHGLIAGVSIGFGLRGHPHEAVEAIRSGGLRFKATQVLELSLVTIPMNAEAVITTIKRYDVGATIGTATEALRTSLQADAPAAPPAPGRVTLTRRDLEIIASGTVDVFVPVLNEHARTIAALKDEMRSLHTRLRQLESAVPRRR